MERYTEEKNHFQIEGGAKIRGLKNICKEKISIFSTDRQFLFDFLFDISKAGDCFEIKILKEAKLDITKAECYLTNDSSVSDFWAKYARHPKLWCVIEDTSYEKKNKDLIRTY